MYQWYASSAIMKRAEYTFLVIWWISSNKLLKEMKSLFVKKMLLLCWSAMVFSTCALWAVISCFITWTETLEYPQAKNKFNQCYSYFYQTYKDFCRLSMTVLVYMLRLYVNKSVAVDYTLQATFMKELISYDNFIDFNRARSFFGRYG